MLVLQKKALAQHAADESDISRREEGGRLAGCGGPKLAAEIEMGAGPRPE
jgi:hypothetical protein